jgi:CHAT domain-containing protein
VKKRGKWKPQLSVVTCLVLICSIPASGSSGSGSQDPIPRPDQSATDGIVIEKVEQRTPAQKEGFQKGDVLLTWANKWKHGVFTSPFDTYWLELREIPFGPITITGVRSGRPKTWELASFYRGADYRPNFAPAILTAYRSGQKLATAGKLEEAADQWAALASNEANPAWQGTWLLQQSAILMQKAKRWDKADTLDKQALRSAESDLAIKTQLQLFHAWSYRWRGDPDTGIKYFEETVLPNTQELDLAEPPVTRMADTTRGLFCPILKDASTAPFSPASLRFGRPGPLARSVLIMLALMYQDRGDLEKVEQYLEQARAGNRLLGGEHMDTLLGVAGVAYLRGDMRKADRFYRQVLTTCHMGSFASLFGLANIANAQGDNGRARSYFSMTLQQLRQDPLHSKLNLAVAVGGMGTVAHDDGHYRTAERYYKEEYVVLRRLWPESSYMAHCLEDLGNNSRSLGRLHDAEKYLRSSVKMQQNTDPASLGLAATLYHLGDLLLDLGNLNEAEQLFRQALEIRARLAPGTKYHADALASLGKLMRRKHDFAAAEDFYKQALDALDGQLSRLAGDAEARSIFRAYRKNYYREYVDLLTVRGKPELAYEVLERSRGRTLMEILVSSHADVHAGVDPALLERDRSLQIDINAKSERRIRLMSEQHSEEALKVVEKEIANLLLQYKDVEGQIRTTSPGYAALTQPQPLTAKEIQTQLLDPDTLLLEYSLGEERSYVFAVTPDSLEAFGLPKRAVIEKAARRVYSLLTERNRSIPGETAPQKQLRLSKAAAEYRLAAAALSRMLLGPVATQFGNKRLLIVSDGALAYIPFAVLPEPPPAQSSTSKAASATAAPLVVKHEIVNLPSASVLAVLRQQQIGRAPAPKAVAVLADPVFDPHDSRVTLLASAQSARGGKTRTAPAPMRSIPPDLQPDASWSAGLLTRSAADVGLSRDGQLSLPRLLFSRREADAIMSVVPPGAGKKAVDFDASRATATSAELSQYRIVHFATHGLLDSVHPELSGLVFSMVDKQGHPQNGFLELQDIYNLNLPADLVVLSACETGLGKEISGEGLVGLTRGFMHAGASRVMASLWKVSDAGTATLMANFYTVMEKEHLPPAAALRAAQMRMWEQKRWRDPYYWAAFQIQGEWK